MSDNFLALKFIKLAKATPKSLKPALRFFRLHKFVDFLSDKYSDELGFQAEWAKEFSKKENRDKVLEYWKTYRYLDEIKNICPFTPETEVLDVGCGISTVLHFVEGKRIGIDPLAEEYKKLYSYPADIAIQKSLGETIPFPAERFDAVFCSNVLDHVTNPEKTLSEIYRVMKKDAHFILTVEIFDKKIERNPAHPYCFMKEDIRALLDGRFRIVFHKESPWIGMRNYVNGAEGTDNKEAVFVLQKI